MSIWVKNNFGNHTLDPDNLPEIMPSEINAAFKKGFTNLGTLMDTIDIDITEIGDDFLKATMQARPLVYNPLGVVHGGAYVALAETVASFAANIAVDTKKYYCVGQEINANHLKSTVDGILTATATPIHLGKRSSVWSVIIHNENNEPCCISRMTAAVIKHQ